DVTALVEVVVTEGQLLGLDTVEQRREADTVVGTVPFFADHDDPPRCRRVALDVGLDEPVTDHAVADDDDIGPLDATGVPGCRHRHAPTRRPGRRYTAIVTARHTR